MRLIAFGQFHPHTKRNQLEFPLLQRHIFRRPQINPVRLAVYIGQFLNFIRKIFDLDRFHSLLLTLSRCSRSIPLSVSGRILLLHFPFPDISRCLCYRSVTAVQYRHGRILLTQAGLHIDHTLVGASPPAQLRIF